MKATSSTISTNSVLSRQPEPRVLPAGEEPWEARLGGVRLLFGEGRLGELGRIAAELGRRPLLVSDPGLRRAGHEQRALEALRAAGLETRVFDRVEENPSSDTVAAGALAAKAHEADVLVAVGGGSVMDAAKGINFVFTNGGAIEDYQGWGKAAKPMLPAVAAPTTAGTGSDAQSYALISRSGDHSKLACGDPKARFEAVLLDPELLASAPRKVLAHAGIDALSHAVESYVSSARNPISALYAREAFRLLAPALPRLLADPTEGRACRSMLLGAHLAGAAIEQSMLGAAHSLANPLTARCGVVHGAAVGMMLPAVVRFNAAAVGELYAELLATLAADHTETDHAETDHAEPANRPHEINRQQSAAERLAVELERLTALAGLPRTLSAAGVDPAADLVALAAEAADQWTARFNPRPVSAADLESLYREVSSP